MTSVPPSPASLRGAVDLSSLVNRPPAGAGRPDAPGAPGVTGMPGPAANGTVSVPALVLAGTDANFGDILELSMAVPVLVSLSATWSEDSTQFTDLLSGIVTEYAGRLLLATVDVDTSPQLAQAFQAQSLPTVAAVIGGQPVQLFSGVVADVQVRDVLERLLQLAAQNGVSGVAVPAGGAQPDPAAQAEPELPPHHRAAYDAIERGDYDDAIAEYKRALASDPRDTMAVAGLAQVSLLARLKDKSLDEIRSAAAAAPKDLDAQLLVADLDLSGGHVEDAFDRLLALFPDQDPAGKNRIRERLLELFEVVGAEDPRVPRARARLAALLY